MKTCPICHARAFDDAEACFGCLHRFTGAERPATALQPARRPDRGGGGSAEEGLARAKGAVAEVRPPDARPAVPCPFAAVQAAATAERAASAVEGERAGAARIIEAPPFDGRGWIVRFEFPGFAPVDDPAGAPAQLVRPQGAEAEGLVVSLRPSGAAHAPADVPARAGRGVHARAEARPPLGVAAEGR